MRELFAKGKRGLVYLEVLGNQKIIVKVKNPRSEADTLKNEAEFLQKLNEKGIGPGFRSFDGKELKMEFIEGEVIEEFIAGHGEDEIRSVLGKLLDQMFTLDSLGINKQEMMHPQKHIIIRHGEPVLIDFERCRWTEKPKNLSQLMQYLTSKNLSAMLREKKIILSKEEMIALAKQYKKNMNSENFEKIKEIIAG